jgi:hypothetical protein
MCKEMLVISVDKVVDPKRGGGEAHKVADPKKMPIMRRTFSDGGQSNFLK